MLRSLAFFWRSHLAVALGAAVATAVLTGALFVGDSLKTSLRNLVLGRLGPVHWAVAAERPFRASLAGVLAQELDATVHPVFTVPGTGRNADSGAAASGVQIYGVDGELLGEAADLQTRAGAFVPVALNHTLAAELDAELGTDVVLSFNRPSDIPRESLLGRADPDETVALLRATVAAILPGKGLGDFSLASHQTAPRNAFVDRDRLLRAIYGRERQDRSNLLLVDQPSPPAAETTSLLLRTVTPADAGLVVSATDDAVILESDRYVLDARQLAVAQRAQEQLGERAFPTLTYLANRISVGDRTVPYSTVVGLEGGETLVTSADEDGGELPPLDSDGIYLDAWTAEDLRAAVGDAVTLQYFVLGARDELATEEQTFQLQGVVAMEGLAVDPTMTPEFPGLHDAENMVDWDPPFPVDLRLIREHDEEYWDQYAAAPKAFVTLTRAQELWKSRFGDVTSLRWTSTESQALASELNQALANELTLEESGLRVLPLREQGLESSTGATDFAGLFLALSTFLIAAAALLIGLLFRLGVERRAAEVGLLQATGFQGRTVRRRFLSEGLFVGAVGCALGLLGAWAYAKFLLWGLRSWWLPAIGSPVLELHTSSRSLVIGWVGGLLVVGLAIAWALRSLRRVPTPQLLRGVAEPPRRAPSRRSLWVATTGLAVALLALAGASIGPPERRAPLAFLIGASLLVAGLATTQALLVGRRHAPATSSLATVGWRNAARFPGRSLLSVSLVAAATFVIVVVAANRVHSHEDTMDRSSGLGGYSLWVDADTPLVQDPRRLSPALDEALGSSTLAPFRVLPGDDVSCLNLFRPERPRLLGVPESFRERGGFTFRQSVREAANPWDLLAGPLEDGAIPAIADYNSALWILHSGLGQDVVIEDESGGPLTLRLVGLLSRSVFQSELLISEENFQKHFPTRAGYQTFLADPPMDREEQVLRTLETEFERFGFDATTTRDRLASFLEVETTYLSTFQTLGGLGLLLGTLGLGIISWRNVLERRRELAALAAFGFSRRRIGRLVLLENLALLAVGLLIGALAGLIAAAPQVLGAGQAWPWASLLRTLAGVAVVGAASTLVAVLKTARLPLIESLRSP